MAAGRNSKGLVVFLFICLFFKFLPLIGCSNSNGWPYTHVHTHSTKWTLRFFFFKKKSTDVRGMVSRGGYGKNWNGEDSR